MRELTCIGCPMGCTLKVEKQIEVLVVSGNLCRRGEKYAIDEITAPKRMVTSTVRLHGGSVARLSVRTQTEIPKDKIFDCMEEIRRISVQPPVKIGDVLLENCAGTGVAIIATKNA